MATDDVTPILADADGERALPYRGYLAPPHTAVHVYVERYCWGFHIAHRGTPDDLIACGAVTAEQIAPRRSGKCTPDPNGQKVRIRRLGKRIRRLGKLIELIRPIELDGSAAALASVAALPGIESWMLEHPHGCDHALEGPLHDPASTHDSDDLDPARWRAMRLGAISGAMFGLRDLCDLGAHVYGKLEDGYRIKHEDAEAFVACVDEAMKQLTAIMERLQIKKAAAIPACGLRLVVDNTGRDGGDGRPLT